MRTLLLDLRRFFVDADGEVVCVSVVVVAYVVVVATAVVVCCARRSLSSRSDKLFFQRYLSDVAACEHFVFTKYFGILQHSPINYISARMYKHCFGEIIIYHGK